MIEPPLENEPRQSSWSPFFVKLRCRQEGFQSPCIARISALIHSLSSFQIHGRILRHRCYFNLSPNRRFCNYGRSLIMINSHCIQSTKFEEPVTCLVGDCLRTIATHLGIEGWLQTLGAQNILIDYKWITAIENRQHSSIVTPKPSTPKASGGRRLTSVLVKYISTCQVANGILQE